MTTIVEGKRIAQEIQQDLAKKVALNGEQLFFHIVYVGNDQVIENYLNYKQKFADAIGVEIRIHRFSKEISQDQLSLEIQKIVTLEQPMIIQLPLPGHLDTQVLLNQVPASLDVDVLSREARLLFAKGENPLVPPVVGSIIEIFTYYDISLENMKIAVIGEGMLVGGAMALWLDAQGYDYQVITQETSSEIKKNILHEADIIISGAGVPGLITATEVKEGVIVIDAGTSESGSRIVGDVDTAIQEKSTLFTPVPGGIGPLTIALLYRNVIDSYLYV